MAKILSIALIVLVLVMQNEAARILAVYPTASISHQIVYRPLTLELVRRGHEVVVITTDPAYENGKAPANLTEIDVKDISYGVWKESYVSKGVEDQNDLMSQYRIVFETMPTIFMKQLESPQVQKIINDKSRKFDLIIVEAFLTMGLSYAHLYPDAHVIQFNSFGAFPHSLETHGMPMHPLVHPTSARQRVYNPSFWEKLREYYHFYELENIYGEYERVGESLLRKVIGEDMPPLKELRKRVDMLFLNVYPMWEMNRPSPPNVIYLGGLHQKPVTPLPQDLKSYLDSSKNGVIYISFGTNMDPSLLPPHKIAALVKVFSKLPFDVLWKWPNDDLPGRTANIKISKWLPQSDLLRHPKVKLFITQGGLQSTDEAITAGVPMIGVPMLGDQWFNTEQYVYHKIGLRLDLEDLTAESLEKAIMTIISNESEYRENVATLRSLMRDQTQPPLERAIWWTEYVLRHKGAKHLRSPAANMSWFEYLEVELLTYLLGGVLLVISVVVFVIFSLWRKIRPSKSNVKVKRG